MCGRQDGDNDTEDPQNPTSEAASAFAAWQRRRDTCAIRREFILVRSERRLTTPADLSGRKVHQTAACALDAVQGPLLPLGISAGSDSSLLTPDARIA